MAFDKNSSPVYGGGQIRVNLPQGLPMDCPLYLVFEGPFQRHITTGIRCGDTCWAVIPAHGEAERVQVTLFSYYNNDICALVTSPFVFDHNPTYFLACFLVESVYNVASLEDLELIKSDRFDLGEEDLDTLDQRLYLALRYLEIPEWWHLLGPNSPAVSAEHIPRESLLHFVAHLGLYKVALFLLDKNGAQEALSLPNRHGYLPKDIAAEKGHANLAALLTEYNSHSVRLCTETVATDFGIICQLENGQKSMSTITRRPVEEDIFIYHEMISQDGEVDELVQRQCQTEWPTEGAENEEEITSMYDGDTDSGNKLRAIIDKTRSLQDAIKNVTTEDLNISEDDLESPGQSAEDLSDVMSDKDGNTEHVDTMDQDVYERTITAVEGLNEDLFKLRDIHRNKLLTQDLLARHSNSCPSLENEGRFSPLPVVHQTERHNSMLNLAKDDVEPNDSQYTSHIPLDANDTANVQIYVNGRTVDRTDGQEDHLDSSLNNFLKDYYGGNTPGVRRRSWGPNLMTQNAIGHRIGKNINPVLSGKSCSLNSLDGDDSDNEMSNDDTEADQTPASPTDGSHDQVVPPVAMEGIVVTPPTSSQTQKYNQKVDEAHISNQGQTLTKTLHSKNKELITPRQPMKSLSQDGETTMSGQSGDSTDDDLTSNLIVPHSTMTKSLSTPSIPAAVSPTEKKSFQKESKHAQFRRQDEVQEDDDEKTNRLLGRTSSKSRRKSELSLLDFLSESANYSTEEQAKIAKKEKEEKDKKRKSSVFSRLGSSYRTKKHKEKENKGRHGHHFVAVSFSNSTSCDVCSKSMANKSALRCENCSINVHENSCKEQSPICDKHRQNIRVPQRSKETGSMTNLHTQDKQLTTGTAYSGLRPTQSFKERSPSTGVPLRNQVTSSPPGVSAPLSAIPDSSEPDDNQGDRHHAAIHRRSLPNASYSVSPQYQRPGYQHWRRAREKLMGIDKAIHEETEQERLPPGQDPGPQIGLSSANSNSLESLDDVDGALEVTSHIDEELRNLSTVEPETWSETLEKKRRKHFNSQEIKRQDTIWELIQTERHHCRTLKILQRVYGQGILHDLGMSPSIVERLFPKLDDLIELHMNFLRNLQDLQKRNPDRSVEKIGDTLVNQFSGESAEKMKCAYGAFCCGHKESVSYYKDLLVKDRKFHNFVKKCNNDSLLLQKREIPDFVLLVTQRPSKYLGLLDTLIKRTTVKEERQNISRSLQLSKEILQSIDDRVHEQERIQRLREIYEGFDPRATTLYKGKKFKKSDISTHGRKLVKEGTIGLKSARGKVTEATMVVLTDLIFFMQEQNGKYTFFSQDNKSCAIPLFELLVREKSDTKESKGIYLISQNKDNPEMYEIVCNTNSEREAWIREIRAASEKCPPEDEIQPQESDEEERRQMMERSNKIREIIELLHRKDEEMRMVCDHKNQLVTELLDIYNMRDLSKRPDSMGSDEGAEHMDAIQAAIQQATVTASNLTNMLGGGSGANQLMRHVSSVGEHVSSSFTITPIAKRAETFAGFDTTFELSKGDNSRRRQGGHLMDMEGQQLDSDSELSYDQQSLVYNDSNDSSSCNYDSQSTTGSVMEAYSSQLPVYLAGDHMRQLSTSLNNIVHLTSKYGTEVESLKAQLAEANERINKLSADVNEKRGGSYKHHTLEELRNIQEQVQREKAVMALQREKELSDVSMERALLEDQRRQLEKDQADLAAKKDELKRQKEAFQKQIDLWQQEKLAHRDSPIEKTISAPGMVVLRDKDSLEGTSSTDPKPTSYPDSPNQNSHRRSASADFCSTIENDLERLRSGHVKTRRELPVRPDQSRGSGIHVTPSFSSSVSSKLAGNKNQQLPVHLYSAKNEHKKSASPSQLSQSVGSGKGVQQVLPFKLADATGGKSSTQGGPPPMSGSQSVSNLYKSNRPQHQKSSSSSSLLGGVLKLAEPGGKGKSPNNNADAKGQAQENSGQQKNGSGIFYM